MFGGRSRDRRSVRSRKRETDAFTLWSRHAGRSAGTRRVSLLHPAPHSGARRRLFAGLNPAGSASKRRLKSSWRRALQHEQPPGRRGLAKPSRAEIRGNLLQLQQK